ncbi:mechanosensitive ion channel domain-containing protein [Methylomonas methanica]|uniref:Small-conductance mechanosensitive channel n=1 Tax=Methylomonas methanica (strain DSM 25384 / MC09) TaxID=857087 RepID=G0A6P3_METMM|nr:mechanosensitive ion channel domain-containing protein [Methylomonas methanica]AEF99344.1 MscS Mechanosensitive ion channel [Methylomonas methanica MC09]
MRIYQFFLVLIVSNLLFVNTGYADAIDQILTDSGSEASSVNTKPIELEHSKQTDKQIKKRLEQIYSELEGLNDLQVAVASSVVTLTGTVDSKAAEQKALDFARNVQGVIDVKNQLITTHDLKKRLDTVQSKFKTSAEQLLVESPLYLLALLTFCLFWFIGSWLGKRQQLYRKIAVNYFIADLLGKFVHLVCTLLGIVLALSLLDATALLGTILGAAGILGLAISFAVRDTVENFIASLLLSIRNPFEVNDAVDIDGFQGSVVRLTSRATILMSFDGNHVRIPNSTVFKAVITNYTRHPNRRFEFDLGIGYSENLSRAQELILNALENMQGILTEPKPQVIVQDIGDSNVVLRIYAWLNQTEYGFLKVRSEAIKRVKECVDQANISVPRPIYDLNMIKASTASEQSQVANVAPASDTTRDEIADVSADNELKEQILEDNLKYGDENLLDSDSKKEI